MSAFTKALWVNAQRSPLEKCFTKIAFGGVFLARCTNTVLHYAIIYISLKQAENTASEFKMANQTLRYENFCIKSHSFR